MDNYASVLESYLIPAEEGLMDKIKDAGKRAVEFLKRIKDKLIALFKRIIDKFKKPFNEAKESRDRDTKHKDDILKYQNAISLTIQRMTDCIGYLSKAVGASRLVNESDDASVQRHLDNFYDSLDRAQDASEGMMIDYYYNKEIFEIQKKYATKLEAIKNVFVQEIDLAIKIFSAGSDQKYISNAMVNDLCQANSKFLSLYSKVLNQMY